MSEVKKKKPWLKWYPSDWRGEPSLRMVSRAARSVWIDMLGLMHESTLEGYLLLNGKKPTPEQLARVLGDDIRDLVPWLEELATAGVYAETDDGIIYSRRMVRDAKRADEGRSSVELRGGAWGKSGKNKKGVPDTDPNRVPTQDPNTYIPLPLLEKTSLGGPGTPDAPKGGNSYTEEFNKFWLEYPRNDNMIKFAAFEAWNKQATAGVLPPLEKILIAVAGYRKYIAQESKGRSTPFRVLYADKWLKQRGWESYLDAAPKNPIGSTAPTGPGWEEKFTTWPALREDLRARTGGDVAWANLLADCRAVSDTELICPTTFHRDTLQAKFGESGEKLAHIFKAPVQFRFERPTARH